METIQKICESTNAPPVLYVTASTDNETLQRVKVTKPVGVIYKPYNDEDLMFNIRLALHKMAK